MGLHCFLKRCKSSLHRDKTFRHVTCKVYLFGSGMPLMYLGIQLTSNRVRTLHQNLSNLCVRLSLNFKLLWSSSSILRLRVVVRHVTNMGFVLTCRSRIKCCILLACHFQIVVIAMTFWPSWYLQSIITRCPYLFMLFSMYRWWIWSKFGQTLQNNNITTTAIIIINKIKRNNRWQKWNLHVSTGKEHTMQ